MTYRRICRELIQGSSVTALIAARGGLGHEAQQDPSGVVRRSSRDRGARHSQTTTTGSLTVRVNDSSGASVPDAQLEVKDLSTNSTTRAATNESGAHTFPNLPFGTYSLTITAKGFQNQVFESVTVQTARDTVVSAVLKVGATFGDRDGVDHRGAAGGAGRQHHREHDRHQAGGESAAARARHVRAGVFDAGVGVELARKQAGTFNNLPGGAIVSADYDGTQAISNRFRSGGYTYGTSVVQPRIENIAEMTVQTAQLDLSGNGTSAMKIALVTRRGSNAFHGRVFEDFQNTALNANSWLNNARAAAEEHCQVERFRRSAWAGRSSRTSCSSSGLRAVDRASDQRRDLRPCLSANAQRGLFEYRAANGSIQNVDVLGIGASAGGPATRERGHREPAYGRSMACSARAR